MLDCGSRRSRPNWLSLMTILSDFHGRVHKPMAKQLIKLLEPHRPLFVEEPLLPGHPQEMKDLYDKTSIPIAVSPDLGGYMLDLKC